jgi:CRP-like cAMP-binding protein
MTDREAVMDPLRKVPLFANLKDEDKVCIEETEEWRFPAGEMLVEEGKRTEYFFVLLEGLAGSITRSSRAIRRMCSQPGCGKEG